MNSTLVVLRDTSVCNFKVHPIGHPTKMIINPILDLAVDKSRCAVSGDQFRLKSALHHKSKDCGLLVACKYLSMCSMACTWHSFGFTAKQAHWCTVYAKWSFVLFFR